jgi:hypothetical protein
MGSTPKNSREAAHGPAVLRAELKEWERNFSAANGGRKARRDDIKKDAAIGAWLHVQFPRRDPTLTTGYRCCWQLRNIKSIPVYAQLALLPVTK